MRKIIKGKEEIILREDPDGGFTSIEVEKLTKHMDELFSEESLIALADKLPMSLTGLKKMTLIAVIKSDIAGNDNMGWKQHQKVLQEDGYDV